MRHKTHRRRFIRRDRPTTFRVRGHVQLDKATSAAIDKAAKDLPQKCVVCGCTDDDCSGCIQRTGVPCHWVAPNLCSACA